MKRGIFILCILFVLCFSFSVYSTEQDLAAYWNFDEGSGDIAGDSSGSGNNGYLGGAGVYVKGKPTWTTGIKNSALSFNGVNNYILVDDGVITATPNPSLDIKADQSFTISVWIKTSAFGKNMALLERYDGMPYHTLRISNNNKASFTIRGADGGEPSTSGGILLNDGNWHNVVAVRDVASDKLLIYIDGILETGTADTSVGDLGTLAMTFIGMSSGGTNYFEGLMDEYKIYKRALTANEIKSQYDSMFTSASNPLVYFDFEEVKNGFIEDLSGNGYNGVPNFYIKNNPTSSMLSQFGLTNFYPTGITDSNTDTYGWHTDSSTEGAYLAIDLGEGNTKKYRKARVHTVLGQPYKGIYFVQYSDDNINWINAATGFNPNGSGNGWQEKVWDYVGSHRYWRLYLTNTPGPGAWLDDLELYEESVTIVEGKIGKAIQFNPSTGDAINLLIPPINTQKDSKVTVEFWMYWDGTASNIPFGFETYHIIPSSTNLAFGTGANDLYGANINDLANRWVHIVAEFNNGLTSLNKLYINGVKKEVVYISGVAGASYKGQVTPSARISGWATSGALKLKGKIDEFRIYNGVLSEEDVLKHYEGKFGGLVASWNFDEESTTIALDSSGSKNNGEIKGPIKVEGIKGKALSFDGVNDYIDIGPGQLSVKKEMTLEAWFKTKSATGGGDNTFIYRRSGNYGVWLGEKEGKIDFGFWDQNTFYRAISSKTYNDDKWHYAVGTYDNIGDLKLYVDGIEVGYSPASGDIYYQSAYSAIGRNANENNRYWKGEIDEVKVYSKALTAEEIKKSYDETKPQSQEPIAYWNFDEGSGTIAADSSGNGNTGTLMNNPTWVDGIKGKALSFDGVDDRINIANPNNAVLNPNIGTVELWVRPNGMAGDYIFSHLTDRFSIYLSSSTDLSFYYANVNTINLNPNFVDNSGIWHHVAVTYNAGGECKMYVDGTQAGSGTCAAAFPVSSADVIIGWGYLANYGFNGLIDEVKVYSKALTAEEIKKSYDETKPQSQEPIAYWNFDEGSGTIAADSSGNGNTGTLMNNPTWVEGIKGKALSFDGSNDYVDAGNPTILNFGSKSFSIYSWIKTKDTANYKTIVSKGTQNMANTDRYYMRIESSALSGKFHSSIADGTNTDANIYSIKTLLHDDKWHNVVMTVDKDDAKLLKIYIDGLLDSSVSISSIDNIDSETSFRVGMLGTQGYYFNGLIDEVKIYNRVLSDSEILTNYQNLLSPSPTCQTSCYWKVGNKVTGGNEQITVNSGTTVQAKADCLKNNDGNLLTEGTQVNFVVKDYDLLSKDDIVGQQISNVIAGSSTIDIVTNYVEDGEDQNELYFYIEGIEDCNSGDGANNLLYVNELGCVQDADCGAGQVCESGGCVPAPTVQCETSANCLVGENCVGGSCVASVCTSNNNCNVGEVCLYGVCNVVSNDNDMDGMPNDYETSHNLNPNNPNDAATDLDNDGITNLEEYLGNTDPIVPDNTGIATISEKTGSEVGSISSLLSKMELNFPVPKKYTITTTADNVDLSNLKSVDIYPSYEVEGQKVFCEDPVNVEIET